MTDYAILTPPQRESTTESASRWSRTGDAYGTFRASNDRRESWAKTEAISTLEVSARARRAVFRATVRRDRREC